MIISWQVSDMNKIIFWFLFHLNLRHRNISVTTKICDPTTCKVTLGKLINKLKSSPIFRSVKNSKSYFYISYKWNLNTFRHCNTNDKLRGDWTYWLFGDCVVNDTPQCIMGKNRTTHISLGKQVCWPIIDHLGELPCN